MKRLVSGCLMILFASPLYAANPLPSATQPPPALLPYTGTQIKPRSANNTGVITPPTVLPNNTGLQEHQYLPNNIGSDHDRLPDDTGARNFGNPDNTGLQTSVNNNRNVYDEYGKFIGIDVVNGTYINHYDAMGRLTGSTPSR